MASGLIEKRYCTGLPSSVTAISTCVLLEAVGNRIRGQAASKKIDRLLSKSAYTLARKSGANLFLYSYYGYEAFERCKAELSSIARVLFQLHPHPLTIRRILSEEMERLPFAAKSIRDEQEFNLSEDQLNRLIDEPKLATACITASSFTRKTLEENGVPTHSIQTVPYGVDTSFFKLRNRPPAVNPFRVIFVGRMNQRKGLADLLEAVRLLGSQQIEVVLCGRGYVDHNILSEYRRLNIRVCYNITQDELLRELHRSHVFVMPSLAEGFGHVLLEAMATGLPVITTDNTGAPDIVLSGKHGYIVPIRSPRVIAECLEDALRHPDHWYELGQEAGKQARLFTWERFRQGIVRAYRSTAQSNPVN
ncbi:glycosyltransferase family 4 protein [Nostoc sp. CHAB 5834]|nr:glycosyltransferase family 4 protein [Nostoc sp. CHAB 5834]